MKYLLTCVLLALINIYGNSQKITIRFGWTAGGSLPKDGEIIKAMEFKVDAPVSTGTGGTTIGKASPSEILVKKNVDSSSTFLLRRIVAGTFIPTVVIDYSDDKDVIYYTVTITDAFVTKVDFLTPECPGCLSFENVVGFSARTIKLEDKKRNYNVIWNIAENKIQ